MKNYAEELVFWYLRFNGFFMLENYVLHRNSERKKTFEGDLMASRFPNVYEKIGGQENDWDKKLCEQIPHFTENMGRIICEVKSGSNIRYNELVTKEIEKLCECLMRFGFYRLNSEEFDIALSTLEKDKSYVDGKYTVVKLLVTSGKA